MKMIRCENNYGDFVELPKKKFEKRPCVYAILRNNANILVCKTKSTGKLWFPGGGIDEGETHKQALARECMEEAGIINIEIKRLLYDVQNYFYYEPGDLAMNAQLSFYECFTKQLALKQKHEIDDNEAIGFEWVEVSKIQRSDLNDLSEEIYKILQQFR